MPAQEQLVPDQVSAWLGASAAHQLATELCSARAPCSHHVASSEVGVMRLLDGLKSSGACQEVAHSANGTDSCRLMPDQGLSLIGCHCHTTAGNLAQLCCRAGQCCQFWLAEPPLKTLEASALWAA